MKWTHEIPVTKNGKERPQSEIEKDRAKVKKRIDRDIICPMNWLQECLDKIQGTNKRNVVDTKDFFINMPGLAASRQMSKIRRIVEEYDGYTKHVMRYLEDTDDNEQYELLIMKTE